MLWEAATTAFFGFLRSSEYVSPSLTTFDPTSTLCYEDVSFDRGNIIIHLKSSKTDPFRIGCNVCLAHSRSSVCPVTNLNKYLPYHQTKTGPLFHYQNGSYLTRRKWNSLLKEIFKTSRDSPISSHSFRIGAATTAAAAGIHRWLIQQLGRWTSDCFRSYI